MCGRAVSAYVRLFNYLTLNQKEEATMLRLIKFGFLAGVAVFVCYHFWPHETVRLGHKVKDTTISAAQAGYDAARK